MTMTPADETARRTLRLPAYRCTQLGR